MSRGSIVASFSLNIILIIVGLFGLGFIYFKDRKINERIGVSFGFLLSQLIILPIFFHTSARNQEVYNKNECLRKGVSVFFWICFIVNLILITLIILNVYWKWKSMEEQALGFGTTSFTKSLGNGQFRFPTKISFGKK